VLIDGTKSPLYEGEQLSLECYPTYAAGAPEFIWTYTRKKPKDRQDLFERGKKLSTKKSLLIPAVAKSDSGVYTCAIFETSTRPHQYVSNLNERMTI
jgi:hypothetical protein